MTYWRVWLLCTGWCAGVAAATIIIVNVCILMPAAAWPFIGWAAAGLAFTAYLSFFIWLNQGDRK